MYKRKSYQGNRSGDYPRTRTVETEHIKNPKDNSRRSRISRISGGGGKCSQSYVMDGPPLERAIWGDTCVSTTIRTQSEVHALLT